MAYAKKADGAKNDTYEVPSGVRRYRKKPIEIEAIRFTLGTIGDCCRFCECGEGDTKNKWSYATEQDRIVGLIIHTLEGHMQASYGDWIIRGVKGELYPCKPDIFEATYELAE